MERMFNLNKLKREKDKVSIGHTRSRVLRARGAHAAFINNLRRASSSARSQQPEHIGDALAVDAARSSKILMRGQKVAYQPYDLQRSGALQVGWEVALRAAL